MSLKKSLVIYLLQQNVHKIVLDPLFHSTISKVILEILYFLTNLSRCHRFLSFLEKFDIFYEKLTRELCESVKENC